MDVNMNLAQTNDCFLATIPMAGPQHSRGWGMAAGRPRRCTSFINLTICTQKMILSLCYLTDGSDAVSSQRHGSGITEFIAMQAELDLSLIPQSKSTITTHNGKPGALTPRSKQ
ncbi:hypothetical protein GDO81_025679 [Engystomops pustulosus]|uniref:Uncharacterized protein n=1 Tax=Engystomops pustulosus TaxID=76066 RepID=A0AAV6YHY4_ENGPU|nr:hypothetical protein GDO81_025679 [Engystomops pustulosus]